MRRALLLAKRGQGWVEPNPMVGAVVLNAKGKKIGEGYHRRYGGPHAEVFALVEAGKRAAGGTLYVTLEPCCHWGKTPPCTNAILEAGIKRVVVAMTDPFPRVRGRGMKLLRAAGVKVDVGLLEDQAREINRSFIKRMSTGMPYVIAKWAQTLDGGVATATGESKWISSEASRAEVQLLRGQVDAIVVGINTALADDPLLMARPERARDIKRLATRVILDDACRLPLTSQLLKTIAFAPVLVAHRNRLDGAAEMRRAALLSRGVHTLALPAGDDGHLDLTALLHHMGSDEYANVLVEGGPEVMAAFLRAGAIDEAHIYLAPKIIGGKNARRAIGGPDLKRLQDAFQLTFTAVEGIEGEEGGGGDLRLTARLKPAKARRSPRAGR